MIAEVSVGQDRVTLDLLVPPIQDIQIVTASPFSQPLGKDFDRGYIDVPGGLCITVCSNVPWQVTIDTKRSNLYLTPKAYKPITDLMWKNGDEPFQPLHHKSAVVASGPAGTENYVIEIDFRLLIKWGDTPPGQWELLPDIRIEPLKGIHQ